MPIATSLQPALHLELQAVLDRVREARAQPPETFRHWPGVIERPSSFDAEALQRHLSNPLLPPNWVALVFRGQHIPLEQSCAYVRPGRRLVTFGILGGEIVVLVHTERDDDMHVISLRKAEKHETRYYFEIAEDCVRKGR